jgi:hypothetical protein
MMRWTGFWVSAGCTEKSEELRSAIGPSRSIPCKIILSTAEQSAFSCFYTSGRFLSAPTTVRNDEDVQMNNLLPELHEGHAPITLHQLFRDALEAYDDWTDETDIPVVYHLGNPVSIGLVFDHMRDCTDILPNNMVSAITERLTKPWSSGSSLDEMTFSTAARVMCVVIRKRQLHRSGSDIGVFLRRFEKLRSSRADR